MKIYLVKEPGAEDNLEGVVPNENLTQLKRLAVFHQFRSQVLDNEHIGEADASRWQWPAHQEPVIDSRVCKWKLRHA